MTKECWRWKYNQVAVNLQPHRLFKTREVHRWFGCCMQICHDPGLLQLSPFQILIRLTAFSLQHLMRLGYLGLAQTCKQIFLGLVGAMWWNTLYPHLRFQTSFHLFSVIHWWCHFWYGCSKTNLRLSESLQSLAHKTVHSGHSNNPRRMCQCVCVQVYLCFQGFPLVVRKLYVVNWHLHATSPIFDMFSVR